jgi:hypothetical protein
MPIGISYYGSKKPAQGAKPLRTFTLPNTMPKDLTPFGKDNPVDWMTGKNLVQFRKDKDGVMPAGGLADQALVKKSSADSDAEWSTRFFLSPEGVLTVTRPGTAAEPAEAPEDPEALSFVVFQDGGDVKVKVTDAEGTTVEHIIGSVPAGGTTGQVLSKKSDADRDAEWADVSSVVDGTVEGQVLRWNNSTKAWEAGVKYVVDWRLDKTNHKFQAKYSDAPTTWVDITDANGGTLDAGVPL